MHEALKTNSFFEFTAVNFLLAGVTSGQTSLRLPFGKVPWFAAERLSHHCF